MQHRSGEPAGTRRWGQRIGIPVVGGLVLAISDIWLLVAIGGRVGALPVLLFVIAEAVAGGWLIRRRWQSVWRALSDPDRGRINLQRPEQSVAQVVDTGLVVAGGIALIVPGLITALLGLIFLVPFSRRLPAALLRRTIRRRIPGLAGLGDLGLGAAGLGDLGLGGLGGTSARRRARGDGEVVEGEVVEEPSGGGADDPDEPVVIRGEVTDR